MMKVADPTPPPPAPPPPPRRLAHTLLSFSRVPALAQIAWSVVALASLAREDVRAVLREHGADGRAHRGFGLPAFGFALLGDHIFLRFPPPPDPDYLDTTYIYYDYSSSS